MRSKRRYLAHSVHSTCPNLALTANKERMGPTASRVHELGTAGRAQVAWGQLDGRVLRYDVAR